MVYRFPLPCPPRSVQPEGSWSPGIGDGIRAIFRATSVEGLNFIVPSDELRRNAPHLRRKDWVAPYAPRWRAAMIGDANARSFGCRAGAEAGGRYWLGRSARTRSGDCTTTSHSFVGGGLDRPRRLSGRLRDQHACERR